MTKILLFFLLFAIGFACDLGDLEDKPRGIARDFFMYEFMQKNEINKECAKKIFDLVEFKSPKMMNLLTSKIPNSELPLEIQCRNLSFKDLIARDDECFNLGFRLQFVLNEKLDSKLKARLKNEKMLKRIALLEGKNKLEKILKNGDGSDFLAIYNSISQKSKNEIFNIAPKTLKNLSNKHYENALYSIIISRKFPKFSRGLLNANIENVNDLSFFALGLNELESGSKKKALKYFKNASEVTTSKFLRDRALFWCYKISQEAQYLEALSKSSHLNLYSLFAIQMLGVEPIFSIIFPDDEMFKAISQKAPNFHIDNPFEWQILRENIAQIQNKDSLLKVAKLFYYKDSLPHFAYVLNRYYDFSMNFFIMPYAESINDLEIGEKSLLYAVARQESAFIPAVISRSYALGMLQIMPFNVDSFASAQNLKNITLSSMFEPKMALRFGNYYLNHLKKEFSHPLFVSYAYNGGPTFIRNFLKDNFKANEFEPWFSMEFVPYEESRIYGMKVMANYVVYSQINGEMINIDEFMKGAIR